MEIKFTFFYGIDLDELEIELTIDCVTLPSLIDSVLIQRFVFRRMLAHHEISLNERIWTSLPQSNLSNFEFDMPHCFWFSFSCKLYSSKVLNILFGRNVDGPKMLKMWKM